MLPGGFNLYIVLAYAIAGAATYAYVRNVTGSAAAGIASGFAFSSGGFLVSHFGQPMMIEPACWYCVATWALDSYLRLRKTRYLIAVSAALAMCLTAGQPQVAVFAIPLTLGYLLFVGFDRRSARTTLLTYVDGSLAVVLGVSSVALAWLPTLALSTASVRSGLDFGSYVLFSIVPAHVALMLAYPFSSGGGASSVYPGPIVEHLNFVETSNYVPLSALVLAPLASLSGERRIALYWAAVAFLGFLLAMGDATPLAVLTYHLPGFNLFRIPGRHAFEFTFAVAVLAGLGIAAMARGPSRLALTAGLVFGLAVLGLATADVAGHGSTFLAGSGVTIFLTSIATQLMLVSICVCVPSERSWRPALASAAVVVGACTFGLTAYWRDVPMATILQQPPYAGLLRTLPLAMGQRIYTEGPTPELRPNLPLVWGIPEAGGYTPLQFATSSVYLQTGDDGRFLNVDSPIVDVAAIRYFVAPTQVETDVAAETLFGQADIDSYLSASRPNAPRSLAFGLQRPHSATRLAMVTALGASVGLAQGTPVALVVVRGRGGATQRLLLRAGVETAEIAYDRPDVTAAVRHKKADVWEHDGVHDWYVCQFPLHLDEPIASVRFTVLDSGIALNIRKLSLIDDTKARAYPFTSEAKYFGSSDHFRHVADVDGATIFENRRSAPAVWIARVHPQARDARSDDAMASDRERLGRMDLRRDATAIGAPATDAVSGRATIEHDAPERRDVSVACRNECLLVSSMTYSRDWSVEIDGHPTTLLRADGFLQGVIVPPGRHDIGFTFRPAAGAAGLLVSTFSVLAMLIFSLSRRKLPFAGIGSPQSAVSPVPQHGTRRNDVGKPDRIAKSR